MAVGALAYDTTPLGSIGRLDTFSPEFQALVTDKGGMIFHMLRWVIGDAPFDKTVREFMSAFGGKSAHVSDLQAIAEKNCNENLTSFFSQWVDGTGAPEKRRSTRSCARAKASASSDRYPRTSTCSACPWNSRSTP